MKYRVLQTSQYKRELKRAVKRGLDVNLMKTIVAAEQLILTLTRIG